jgi:intracellular septation protein A
LKAITVITIGIIITNAITTSISLTKICVFIFIVMVIISATNITVAIIMIATIINLNQVDTLNSITLISTSAIVVIIKAGDLNPLHHHTHYIIKPAIVNALINTISPSLPSS